MLEIGQIVYSIMGRDSGRYFLVIDTKDKYVYMCDGGIRRLENPKKKNMIHIKAIKDYNIQLKDKIIKKEISNKEIKDILRDFNKNLYILVGKEV